MKIIDAVLDSLYPKRCASCRQITKDGNVLCPECADKLERVKTPVCIACGNHIKDCECDTFIYHFDGIVAPFMNKGVAKDMVYTFKFDKDFSYVDFIVENMANSLLKTYKDINFDFLTFVPKMKSDYNQCKPLAKRLSRRLNIPVKRKILVKVKENKTQHKLSLNERFSNVKDAYCTTEKIKGQTVLLLDDIKTTGATLNECAKQLKFAGAEKVYCVTALIR